MLCSCPNTHHQHCYMMFLITYCTFSLFMLLTLALHPSAARLLTHEYIDTKFNLINPRTNVLVQT